MRKNKNPLNSQYAVMFITILLALLVGGCYSVFIEKIWFPLIYLGISIVLQTMLHIMSRKLSLYGIGRSIAYYFQFALLSIAMHSIPSARLWLLLPFISACGDTSGTFAFSKGQKASMFLSAAISYISICVLNRFFPMKSIWILDVLLLLSAFLVSFSCISKVEHESSNLVNALDESEDNAIRDGLTKLYNRVALNERLQKGIASIGGVGVIMIDIDKFKIVNDTYGHPNGDKVILSLCKILNSYSSKKVTPYRYGGEEFSVVCTGLSVDRMYALAENIRTDFNKLNFIMGGETKHFSISLGIARSDYKQVDSPAALIKMSDDALYVAKESGRNRSVIYDASVCIEKAIKKQ